MSLIMVHRLMMNPTQCAYTTIRWIGKRAHPLISVNYFATWCTLVSTCSLIFVPGIDFKLPANLRQWMYLIFLGVCGFLMQFLLTAGLSHEKSSRATNMVYTQMLFALALDKLLFGTTPSLLSIFGSSLILGSALYVAVQKDAGTKEEVRNADEERGLVERDDDQNDDGDADADADDESARSSLRGV
ncbi:MAG: hypothetical protein M1833_005940 [Piccolia ochrophora]|nr:MAG: hypothetical protein M1833_005940 [Piccolia ochrophora]